MINLPDCELSILIKPPTEFNCGHTDLNNFLISDALDYQNELINKTYIWHKDNAIIGFASLSNDSLEIKGSLRTKSEKNSFNYYPAVKIARLATKLNNQRQGFGSQMLSFLKIFMIAKNKTGCRLLTVDAINTKDVINFYSKNGFNFLTDEDNREKTRIMYFDLFHYYNSIQILDNNIFNKFQEEVSNIKY